MGIKESFTSASSLPAKLFHNKVVEGKRIIPLHAQIIPTNKCNLSCGFCSCGDRSKQKEIDVFDLLNVLAVLKNRGTKALTITGGGEPLMYDKLNYVICYSQINDMEVGLVTNGTLLDKLEHHSGLTWCRISSSDDRVPDYDGIKEAIKINPETDWAFSHVLTQHPNYGVIEDIINFVNKYDFTHVRLVSDLLDLDNVDMEQAKVNIKLSGIGDSKVIYQERKDSTMGTKNCYISLLKPVIAPEGIYPCCGTQYAKYGQKRDMLRDAKMGEVKDLSNILDKQKHFDGSGCDICYYNMYNESLDKIKQSPEHKRFV